MELSTIRETLVKVESIDSSFFKESSCHLLHEINLGKLKIIDLVQTLDPILTNESHEIRLKGIELLTQVIVQLSVDCLIEKEIQVLTEFLCLRILDHQSMEYPALKCIAYFVRCKNKSAQYNKHVLEFLKNKISIRRMSNANRRLIFQLCKEIVFQCKQTVGRLDGDTIYALIQLVDGESHPENLLLCFKLVSFILKNFSDIEPYIDDLMMWLSSYYPIEYTPDDDESDIQRSDLVEALYDCFYASELNSENLQTLFLEKIDTNLMSTKLESLECLIQCYQRFPCKTIKNYASSLWTFVRMSCLKKISLVDAKLLDSCYRALSALATKLNEDEEFFFTFTCNIYDELSIALRELELDLFEPAARLLAHLMRPSIKCFNHVLDKIIPLALKQVDKDELRPIGGLAYIFSELSIHQIGAKLSVEPKSNLDKMAIKALGSVARNENSLKLIEAMLRFRVQFDDSTLKSISNTLIELKLEDCLAIMCLNYDLISNSLLNLGEKSGSIKLNSLIENLNQDNKLSLQLRIVIILLDLAKNEDLNELDQSILNDFLINLREAANKFRHEPGIVDRVGLVHAIILNKLREDLMEPKLIKFFGSYYCQDLIPNEVDRVASLSFSNQVCLPIIRWILKALVLRNSNFVFPIMNLLLNFITSDKVDQHSSLTATEAFGFVHCVCEPKFDLENGYLVHAVFKQKFYIQSCKEIKLRYANQNTDSVKQLLISALASQIPNLSPAIYRKDYEWLLREILKNLESLMKCASKNDRIAIVMYDCLESLVRDIADEAATGGMLSSLINLHLSYASAAETMELRKRALVCLASMTAFRNQSELLLMRPTVVNSLRSCLKDRKRLVRKAAADARLKWILIGQPTG